MKTKADYLEHLIEIATGLGRNIPPQKTYAWWAAKNYAEMNAEHIDLPRLLTEAMLQQKPKS